EIEVNEVVDRTEIRRTRRAAEARVRRGDELDVAREQLDDRQPRIDVLEAVQQQKRIAGAAAKHFELHAGEGNDLSGRIQPALAPAALTTLPQPSISLRRALPSMASTAARDSGRRSPMAPPPESAGNPIAGQSIPAAAVRQALRSR